MREFQRPSPIKAPSPKLQPECLLCGPVNKTCTMLGSKQKDDCCPFQVILKPRGFNSLRNACLSALLFTID